MSNQQLPFNGEQGKRLLENFLNEEQQSFITRDENYGKILKDKYNKLKAEAQAKAKVNG